MSIRPDDLYLVDIIEAAEAIRTMLEGSTRERFAGDDVLCSAVDWKLMIKGEAAQALSPEAKADISGVPFDGIRAFRNRLVHGYFTLDAERVWDIAAGPAMELGKAAEERLQAEFPDTHAKLQARRSQG